jgi:hypothetical protein
MLKDGGKRAKLDEYNLKVSKLHREKARQQQNIRNANYDAETRSDHLMGLEEEYRTKLSELKRSFGY